MIISSCVQRRTFLLTLILSLFLFGVGQVLAQTGYGTNIQSQGQICISALCTPSNTVSVDVEAIHGIDLSHNLPETVLPGQTFFFPKTLTNVGNITENVFILTSNVTAGWGVQLIHDDNNDSSHQSGEITPVPSNLDLMAESIYKFFVVMTAPTSFNVLGTVNITVSASAFVTVSTGYQGNNLVAYGGPLLVSEMNTLNTSVQPAAAGPVFSDLKFDGVLVVNKDYIGRTPVIMIKVLDNIAVSASTLKITIDGRVITQDIAFDGTYLSYHVTEELGFGSHTFIFEAQDVSGNSGIKTFEGRVTDKVAIVGQVLPYPNPYDPSSGEMKITYQLTNETGVRIYIYTITAERIWENRIDAGEEGGHAGYNEVPWDGLTGFYEQVGNGVYLVQITDGKGKLLGTTKILVIR